MKQLYIGLSALAAAMAVYGGPAHAAQITGRLAMAGTFQPMIGAANTQNMALATGIDFAPLGGTTGTFRTALATDDLAPFANQVGGGVIKDFTVSPVGSASTFYSMTVGSSTLTFDLASFVINNQSATFLTIAAVGTMQLSGFDATAATWNFTGESSNGASPRATFAWYAVATAAPGAVLPPDDPDVPPDEETPVPEPATLALLGLGLIAVGYIRRRNADKAA